MLEALGVEWVSAEDLPKLESQSMSSSSQNQKRADLQAAVMARSTLAPFPHRLTSPVRTAPTREKTTMLRLNHTAARFRLRHVIPILLSRT